MTQSQQEAIQKAYSLLGEHFDCSLIVVDTTESDGDEHVAYWSGGSMRALGLAVYVQDRLLRSGRKAFDPEDPHEET